MPGCGGLRAERPPGRVLFIDDGCGGGPGARELGATGALGAGPDRDFLIASPAKTSRSLDLWSIEGVFILSSFGEVPEIRAMRQCASRGPSPATRPHRRI